MQLTVIGCWGGYPAPGGATSAYLLEKDGFILLIDAGSGSLSKLQTKINITDIDAVILSHYHHDHVADIGVLQYAYLVRSYLDSKIKTLPIYGHQKDQQGFNSLTHHYTKGIAYDPDETLNIGPFSITFLQTVHPVSCYGMRISDGITDIVYTADSAFHEDWFDFAKNADLLITDCNFYAGQNASKAGHMTSEEGAFIAEKANVRELMLSHLPQYGNLSELVNEAGSHFSGKVQLAKEDLVWQRSSLY